jgi:hypothetical protein
MMKPAPEEFVPWTAAQRRAILTLLAVLLLVLSIQAWRKPMYISQPQPLIAPRHELLSDRIDPNTADWPTLAALPGIGERRAQDIVAYRERRRQHAPDAVVFRDADDLARVRGIGYAVVNALRPHLIFPPPPEAEGEGLTQGPRP